MGLYKRDKSMLTKEQVLKLKKYSKQAVESLPENHTWIQFLGSLDILCDTALDLFEKNIQQKEILRLIKEYCDYV